MYRITVYVPGLRDTWGARKYKTQAGVVRGTARAADYIRDVLVRSPTHPRGWVQIDQSCDAGWMQYDTVEVTTHRS